MFTNFFPLLPWEPSSTQHFLASHQGWTQRRDFKANGMWRKVMWSFSQLRLLRRICISSAFLPWLVTNDDEALGDNRTLRAKDPGCPDYCTVVSPWWPVTSNLVYQCALFEYRINFVTWFIFCLYYITVCLPLLIFR